MKLTTHIFAENKIRTHKVVGKLNFQALLSELKYIYDKPEYDLDMNVLWDLLEADLSEFSSMDVRSVKEFVSGHWGTGGKSLAALVVSKDIDFGLSRMYETLMGNSTTSTIRIFRNLDEAINWIKS